MAELEILAEKIKITERVNTPRGLRLRTQRVINVNCIKLHK
jgi:hypothetical protein